MKFLKSAYRLIPAILFVVQMIALVGCGSSSGEIKVDNSTDAEAVQKRKENLELGRKARDIAREEGH